LIQDGLIILLLKIGCVSGFVSLVGWIGIYTWLAKWWRNPIGRTLVAKSLLLAALLVPTILSLFFHLSAATSERMAWVDVVLIGMIAPVMIWRSVVWIRVSKGKEGRRE